VQPASPASRTPQLVNVIVGSAVDDSADEVVADVRAQASSGGERNAGRCQVRADRIARRERRAEGVCRVR
jgi:hypothetical protein